MLLALVIGNSEILLGFLSSGVLTDTAALKSDNDRTADEYAWIRENPAEQDIRFLHVWTRKEAVCKMDGRGFALSPRAFDVLTGEYAARLRTEHIFDSLPGAIAAHMHREPIGSDSIGSDFISRLAVPQQV